MFINIEVGEFWYKYYYLGLNLNIKLKNNTFLGFDDGNGNIFIHGKKI